MHYKNNPRAVIMIKFKKVCASMVQLYVNEKSSSRDFDYSLLLNKLILDSRETCHMKP